MGRYRKAVFTHWLNWAFLAVGGIAGLVIDPSIWLAMVPIELGALWVLPDLPMVQLRLDKTLDGETLMREREYYMEQIWGLRKRKRPGSLGARIKALFAEVDDEPLESRVMERHAESFRTYLELRQIVAKLHELHDVRGLSISERDFDRFEQVINAFLRYKLAGKTLAGALSNMDASQLALQIESIDQRLTDAAPQLRSVLSEQRRLCQARLDRLPKLEATLELFRTRADAIVDQLRHVHSQALTDPGMNVNAFLNDLVERQEILNDPMGMLQSDGDELLRDLVSPAADARTVVMAQGRAQDQAKVRSQGQGR